MEGNMFSVNSIFGKNPAPLKKGNGKENEKIPFFVFSLIKIRDFEKNIYLGFSKKIFYQDIGL